MTSWQRRIAVGQVRIWPDAFDPEDGILYLVLGPAKQGHWNVLLLLDGVDVRMWETADMLCDKRIV